MIRLFLAVVVCLSLGMMNGVLAEELPPDAQALIDQNKKAVAEIERTAAQQMKTANDKLRADLERLKTSYTKEGKLDEAVAIRDFLRAGMSGSPIKPMSDPGVLTTYRSETGRVMLIEVTGTTHNSIFGTDVYTHDSVLSTAAVHAGVLKYGETGIVKVTILPAQSDFKPSGRNGVSSSGWTSANYEAYKIEPFPAKTAAATAESKTKGVKEANAAKEFNAVKDAVKKVDSVQGALNKLEAVKDALKK